MKTIIQATLAAINLYSEYFLGLVISILIARNISSEDYGLYSSTIWLAGIFTIAVNSGLSITVTKFIAEFKDKSQQELAAVFAFLSQAKNRRQLLILAITAVLLITRYGDTKINFWLLVILFLCSMLKADYIFKISVFKGLQRFDLIAKTGLIVNPINLVGVIICVVVDPTVEHFIIAYCFTCLVYGLTSWAYNNNLPEKVANQDILSVHQQRINSQIISATVIVFLAALIFRQSQVVVLEQYHFLSEAGYFNIAFLLASAAITLIPGVYQEVLLPKITKAVAKGDVAAQVGQAEQYLLTLSLLVAVPVVIYAEVIIDVLYGENYLAAAFPLQMLIIFKTTSMLTQGANLTLISKDQQVNMAKLNGVLLGLTAVLSIIFVPQWGLPASVGVYGALICCQFLGYQFLARRLGYKMLPMRIAAKIVLAALCAAVPVFVVNYYLSSIAAVVLGSLVFIIFYINLLFVFKGFDASVVYLLKRFREKTPSFITKYLNWGIKCLT